MAAEFSIDVKSIADEFEQSWRTGNAPKLQNFLPKGQPAGRSTRLVVLRELIKIDLEYRWRSHTCSPPIECARLRMEDYVRLYPELLHQGKVPLDLVAEEYRVRLRWADKPKHQEFLKRFPEHTGYLEATLQRVDTEPVVKYPEASQESSVQVPSTEKPVRMNGPKHNSGIPTTAPPMARLAERLPAGRSITDPALPQVHGYELLGVLGRGGMGIVYKARQLALKRLVALKMIVSGAYADEDQLARFQAEAEAVARLRHSNIVQIYDVGKHDGLPYFALEFIEGGSLDKKLAGMPQDPGAAAATVRLLAEAMHAAHQSGIIHRDLKPANVLLATDGTPKITDFGLAKQLDSAVGQTQSGAIMGTPSYMAPEQAAGKTKEIGLGADVYALGAILYEMLTGRPPFRGVTSLDTLDQVRKQEPVRPTYLHPSCPLDLETICLKCLQKNPAHRYANAGALAEDLQRFLGGEPIRARPVGRMEQVHKLIRRNPTVSSLVAAIVVIFAMGSAASIYFGADAMQQASQSRKNEDRAKRGEKNAKENESAAIAARNDLKAANKSLTESRDDLEKTLARSLLRPLGLASQTLRGEDPMLSHHEFEALWELAETTDGLVWYRFVQEGLTTSATTRQFKNRADAALHASVQLDPTKRQKIDQMLLVKLRESAISPSHRADVAFVASGLGELSSETAALAAEAILSEMARTKNGYELQGHSETISILANWLSNERASAVITKAADILTRFINETEENSQMRPAVISLPGLAVQMNSEKARNMCGMVAIKITERTIQSQSLSYFQDLSEGLPSILVHASPSDASVVATKLVEFMGNAKNPVMLGYAAKCLGAAASRLDQKDHRVCDKAIGIVTTGLVGAKDLDRRRIFSEAMTDLAPFMDHREASKTTAKLVDAIMKCPEPVLSLGLLSQALKVVAARLETNEALRISGIVCENFATRTDSHEQWRLAYAIRGTAAQMNEDEARKTAAGLADAIVAAGTTTGMRRDTERVILYDLVGALTSVVPHLDKRDAAKVCSKVVMVLVDSLADSPNPFFGEARAIDAIAPYLDRDAAAKAAAVLTKAMRKAKGSHGTLARGLVKLAEHMTTGDAAETAEILVLAFAREKDSFLGHDDLSMGIAALAPRMEKKWTKHAAGLLVEQIEKRRGKYSNSVTLERSLAVIMAHMDHNEGAGLFFRITSRNQPASTKDLGHAISFLERRASPEDAARIRAQVRTAIFACMTSEGERHRLANQNFLVESLLGYDRPTIRCATAMGFACSSSQTCLANLAAFEVAIQPPPNRLTPQELVDLLKMPNSIGKTRRMILDQLENHYARSFASHWDFVRFANTRNLGLDLTTAPRRSIPGKDM